jgi:hypothetical protein
MGQGLLELGGRSWRVLVYAITREYVGFDGGTECVMLDLNAALLDWTSQIGTEFITQRIQCLESSCKISWQIQSYLR